jgi:hypothetical protein
MFFLYLPGLLTYSLYYIRLTVYILYSLSYGCHAPLGNPVAVPPLWLLRPPKILVAEVSLVLNWNAPDFQGEILT